MKMREDEKQLLDLMKSQGMRMREAAEQIGMAPRRAEYLACKWADLGFYNWGVSHDLGWFEGNDPRRAE